MPCVRSTCTWAKVDTEAGTLVEFDALPGMIESFYAVTVKRRFPNPLIRPLLEASEDGKSTTA